MCWYISLLSGVWNFQYFNSRKFSDNNLVRVTATWLSLQRSEPSVTLTRLSSGLVFDMSGTLPALMETNSVWRGIFGLQPHSSISLLQNRHMENCGALVSPSTCCCSALPCRGSRSWRTATSDVTLSGYLTATGKCRLADNDYSPGNLLSGWHWCEDWRAAFQGGKLYFYFCDLQPPPPHTHTLTLGFVVDLYWLIYTLDDL